MNGDQEVRVSRRKVFRVGGRGAEDSDSDSSSFAAALEGAGIRRDNIISKNTDNQGIGDPGLDSASEISSDVSTVRAGALEQVSMLQARETTNTQGKGAVEVEKEGDRESKIEDNDDKDKEHHNMGRTSSFAFHGKDRTDIRRTRMVHWEGEEGQDFARGDDDQESITTAITVDTQEDRAFSTHPSGEDFPHVLTQTEIRAMNPVVLPGSHKAPFVPATSALIEDRKILSMDLNLPPSIDVHSTYTQTKLSEKHRVQLLLPLNRQSRKAVKKHKFETDRKAALEKLRLDIAKKHQKQHGGTLDFHLNGKPLNAYEEVLVTSNKDFRPHRKLDFKEPNPFYKLNQHEIACRLLLGCVDKPKLANMKVIITNMRPL